MCCKYIFVTVTVAHAKVMRLWIYKSKPYAEEKNLYIFHFPSMC